MLYSKQRVMMSATCGRASEGWPEKKPIFFLKLKKNKQINQLSFISMIINGDIYIIKLDTGTNGG